MSCLQLERLSSWSQTADMYYLWWNPQVMRKAFLKQESICPICRGQGKIVQEHCHQCQGSGTVGARREIRVNIPPGVETGVTFRVRGGDSQENLTIRVEVLDDPVFRREGADVHVNVPISISQVSIYLHLHLLFLQ